jgi:maleate isomerase
MGYALAPQGSWPRLGLVVLSTDEVLEHEARGLLAARDIRLVHSRIRSAPAVTPASLREMQGRMPVSAGLLPDGLDVIGYGCTSASVFIGPTSVAEAIATVHPGVPVTNPISAVVDALRAFGARRIGLVTPYTAQVSGPMRAFLAWEWIETAEEISFGEEDDRRVARITPASTLAAILAAGQADGIEAVFTSCTNLRSFDVIDEAEARLNLPVISSNLALIWHMLRLARVDARGWGPGRLFRI